MNTQIQHSVFQNWKQGIDQKNIVRYKLKIASALNKKAEILQLLTLDTKYAILNETDSGLDIDALKIVSNGINTFSGSNKGVLLITHYQRFLDYLNSDKIYILMDGKIDQEGGKELVAELEKKGYDWIKNEIN